MKIIFSAFICLSVFLFSCNEDKIVDETSNQFKVLIASGENSSKLALYDYNTMDVINPDVMQNVNATDLPGKVTKITAFANNIYLLIPDAFKIIALNALTYKEAATIDFSADNLKPTDICFPNATDAYVAHSNSNKVSLVDITVFKRARVIEVAENPTSIISSGNQVYTSNLASNSISVIDTRTRNQVNLIKDIKAPLLTDITGNGKQAIIIAAGSGKYDQQPKSDAQAIFIDVNTSLIAKTVALNADNVKAVDVKPVAVANTAKEWAFIVTDKQFIRVDTRSDYRVNLVNKKIFTNIIYDIKRRQLMLIEDRNGVYYLTAADEGSGAAKSSKILPLNTTAVYPV